VLVAATAGRCLTHSAPAECIALAPCAGCLMHTAASRPSRAVGSAGVRAGLRAPAAGHPSWRSTATSSSCSARSGRAGRRRSGLGGEDCFGRARETACGSARAAAAAVEASFRRPERTRRSTVRLRFAAPPQAAARPPLRNALRSRWASSLCARIAQPASPMPRPVRRVPRSTASSPAVAISSSTYPSSKSRQIAVRAACTGLVEAGSVLRVVFIMGVPLTHHNAERVPVQAPAVLQLGFD
jgi:hypothetical protein